MQTVDSPVFRTWRGLSDQRARLWPNWGRASIAAMHTRITSAFVPVSDPAAAASWYAKHLALEVQEVNGWSAVFADERGGRVTLLGPASGIAATPGLDWASCSFRVDDLDGRRLEFKAADCTTTDVEGDAAVCLFFTVRDLDGNVLLITDR